MTLQDEWAEANPRSIAMHERARRVIPGGITHDVRHARPSPVAIVSASGSHKTDVDGHDLVCYVMGHGALLLGHEPPPVVEAIERASRQFLHAGSSHEREVAWAERICALVPSVDLVHFTSSGTEATMLALQVARGYTGRDRVLKLERHFHGWHDTAAFSPDGVAGIPAALGQVVTVVPPDLGAVEAALAGHDVAALILEPTGASFGTVPVSFDFLAGLRELTRDSGTLLVFDEVVSGFRWSPGGVQQLAGVLPDLTTMAKIVAGGMPGGALGGRRDVMEVLAFRPGHQVKVKHPGTHNGHPLAAAAGCAMLDEVADGAAQSRADETAGWIRRELNDALGRAGVRGSVEGASSTFRVDLDVEDPDQAVFHAFHAGMLLEGVHIFRGAGFVSTAHTEADVERTTTAFDRTVRRLRADGLV
jgi:glutamate-1-semialdehyde 2,1-aminomutase